MPTSNLADVSTRELEAEINRRRELPRPKRAPTWTCKRCGVDGWFTGQFVPFRFEQQAQAFEKAHRNCPLSIDGGGI